MAAPCLQINRETALVPQRLESGRLEDAASQEVFSRSCISRTEPELTRCGLSALLGWVRRPRREQPKNRPKLSLGGAGEHVVRRTR
jgi:hypothetical protein